MKMAGMACGFVLACAVMGCSEATEVSDQVQNIMDMEDEHVLAVKNGYPSTIPEITYEQAFENFFSSPTWKYFDATTGEQVVEFTGYCSYRDAKVKARLQFILNEDGETFKTGALSFNDVPQSNLIANAMVYKAFEQYASSHQINIDEDENIWTASEDVVVADAGRSNSTEVYMEESDTSAVGTNTNEIEDMSVTEQNTGKKTEADFPTSLVDGMAYYSELDEIGYGYCLSFYLDGNKILFDIITASNRYERCGSGEVMGSNKVRCYMEDDRNNYFDVTWDESQERVHIVYKKKSDYLQSALNGLDLWVIDDASWWFMETETYEEEEYYILPYSNSCYLTDSDVNWMSPETLRLARNEIYARHGRIFNSADLNEYFNAQSWYIGVFSPEEFNDSWLNEYERANLELIMSYE